MQSCRSCHAERKHAADLRLKMSGTRAQVPCGLLRDVDFVGPLVQEGPRKSTSRSCTGLALPEASMKSNRGSCIACATKPPATPSLQHHVMFSHQQPLLIVSVLWLGKIMNMLVGRISWSPTRTGDAIFEFRLGQFFLAAYFAALHDLCI